MKQFNFFSSKALSTLALALLVIFQSCKKNDVQEVPAAGTENIAALQQAVANSVGMSADKVTYLQNEKQFVVDGDSYVSLQDAQLRFASKGVAGAANGATQMRSPYLITPSKVSTIKFYCDATVPAMWVAALDSAIVNWNASGSAVKMQRITATTGYTTKVTTNYSVSSTIATSAYPDYYGNPGNKITINTYQNGLSDSKKVFAITHEVGHSLGLSHTNGTYGYLVAGTPTTDSYSIMNSVCLTWTNFTSYDLLAISTLYPAPVVTTVP
jgi:hypothetical protein